MSVDRDQSFWVDPPGRPDNIRPLFEETTQPRTPQQGPPSLFGPPSPILDERAAGTEAQRPAPQAPVAPPGLSESALVFPQTAAPQSDWMMSAPLQAGAPMLDRAAIADNAFVRWGLLGLGAAILAALTAFFMSVLLLTPVYESATTAIVRSTPASPFQIRGDDLDIYEGFLAGEELAPTFRQLALRPRVLSATSASTGTPMEQIRANVAIRTVPRTPLIVIVYRDPNPSRAAQHADAMAQAMVAVSAQDQWVPGRELAVLETAQIPRSPIAPNPTMNALIAFVAIAAVVGGLGFAIESNRRYSSR